MLNVPEQAVRRPSNLAVEADLPTALKQIDADGMDECIRGLEEAADALAPFEGQPYRRKPVVIRDGRRKRARGKTERTAESGPEETALASLEQQVSQLVKLFHDTIARLERRRTTTRRKPTPRESGGSLTPPEVAKRLRVTADKVRGWIEAGELPATNVAKQGSTRPRYRISEDDLREFDKKRRVHKRAKVSRKRRKKADDDMIEFF
jgi:excisionase family DNA binding protein